jgi:8-oxo-dGTP diphosphatase
MRMRAVAVVIDGQDVLVIRRRKNGREYAVLPGGGVEDGEAPEGACLRELYEETGLLGLLHETLLVQPEETGSQFYFRVSVDRRDVSLGGPELSRVSPDNWYRPEWVPQSALEHINLVPEVVWGVLAEAFGFAD